MGTIGASLQNKLAAHYLSDFGTASFDAEYFQLSLQLGQPNCSQPLLESSQILWLQHKRRLLC